MYILKNAVRNLGRNKGRNILMAVIIFAIIATTAVSIIINTTTDAIISDYKTRFGSEVFLNLDVSNTSFDWTKFKSLTADQQIAFAESDFLRSTKLSADLSAIADNLTCFDEGKGPKMASFDAEGNSVESKYANPTAVIKGSNDEYISEDFQKGLRKLIEGEVYKERGDCIISRQYAELNGLVVGDKITISNCYQDADPMRQELTITGIFEDYTMEGDNAPEMYKIFQSAATNRNNEIVVSFDTVINLDIFKNYVEEYSYSVQATYYLKDPTMLDAFREEIKGKGLPDYYKVETDEASYNKIVGPVEGLAKITNTFLLVVLILGVIILILLSTLSIRERKYEIGVLRAMGMKKGKVAMGLLAETLVLTALCLCLGLGAGSVVSQPVANSMLKNQVEIAEQSEKNQNSGLGMVVAIDSGSRDTKPLSEIEVYLNGQAIVEIILISLLLAGIASFVGILYITKYEPMKILSERN